MAQRVSDELRIALPTDNDAIFHGGGAAFYQYIIRDYKGVITKPWQGGQYGFVRNPVETPAGLIYTRFHGHGHSAAASRRSRRTARRSPRDC